MYGQRISTEYMGGYIGVLRARSLVQGTRIVDVSSACHFEIYQLLRILPTMYSM